MTEQYTGKFRRWLRLVRLGGLGMLVVLLVALGWSYLKWSSEPGYWQVIDATTPGVAEEAERFEQWVSSQITRERAGQPQWRIEVNQQQVNRWLAARLPTWAANQGVVLPEWLQHPMLVLEDGKLIVAGHIQHDDFDKVVSLVYTPTPGSSDDVVVMRLTGLRIGSLGLPTDTVLEQALKAFTPEEQAQINEAMRHVRLSVELGDGRSVEVTDVELREGKATLSCRTIGPD